MSGFKKIWLQIWWFKSNSSDHPQASCTSSLRCEHTTCSRMTIAGSPLGYLGSSTVLLNLLVKPHPIQSTLMTQQIFRSWSERPQVSYTVISCFSLFQKYWSIQLGSSQMWWKICTSNILKHQQPNTVSMLSALHARCLDPLRHPVALQKSNWSSGRREATNLARIRGQKRTSWSFCGFCNYILQVCASHIGKCSCAANLWKIISDILQRLVSSHIIQFLGFLGLSLIGYSPTQQTGNLRWGRQNRWKTLTRRPPIPVSTSFFLHRSAHDFSAKRTTGLFCSSSVLEVMPRFSVVFWCWAEKWHNSEPKYAVKRTGQFPTVHLWCIETISPHSTGTQMTPPLYINLTTKISWPSHGNWCALQPSCSSEIRSMPLPDIFRRVWNLQIEI